MTAKADPERGTLPGIPATSSLRYWWGEPSEGRRSVERTKQTVFPGWHADGDRSRHKMQFVAG
jgi:hypothetical protein